MYRAIVKKYYRPYKTITGKKAVIERLEKDLAACDDYIITDNKATFNLFVPGEKYTTLYTVPMQYKAYIDDIEQAKQWVADVYHCSEIWGTEYSYDDMLLELQESQQQKDPDDYSPDPSLYKVCCDYWNKLAMLFPC